MSIATKDYTGSWWAGPKSGEASGTFSAVPTDANVTSIVLTLNGANVQTFTFVRPT